MAKTKEQKNEIFEKYTTLLKSSQSVFFVDTTNLKATDITDLKFKIAENGGTFSVLKNKIFLKALEGTEYKVTQEQFAGQTGAFFIAENSKLDQISKVTKEFQKKNEIMSFKLGFVDNNVFDAQSITRIADLPSKDILLTQLLHTITSPIKQFLTISKGPLQGFYNALNAYKEKLQA